MPISTIYSFWRDCSYLFSRASFSDVIKNIPQILEDPEHPQHNPVMILVRYVWNVLNVAPFSLYVILMVAVLGVIFYLHPELTKKREW